MVVFNPLAQQRRDVVCVPVDSVDAQVAVEGGRPVDNQQIGPLVDQAQSKLTVQAGKYEVYPFFPAFQANFLSFFSLKKLGIFSQIKHDLSDC